MPSADSSAVAEITKESGGRPKGGIQALDNALKVLRALAQHRTPATLKELSSACGLPPDKVHRYLVSYTHAGITEQTFRMGRYRLGKAALALGLAAMSQIDAVNRAADRMEELVARSGATAQLSVWGDEGPTIVRWHRSPFVPRLQRGVGATLPLLSSATGRVFLAYAPDSLTRPIRERELLSAADAELGWHDIEPTEEGLERLIAAIRQHGVCTISAAYAPGVVAMSAPIFDWQGEIEAALTLISSDQALTDPLSHYADLLKAVVKEASATVPNTYDSSEAGATIRVSLRR